MPGFVHCPAGPVGAREGNAHLLGVWESWGSCDGRLGALGLLSGSAGDWAWVWLGAVWMEALHPLGWVQEDSLEQLSVGFGFVS